MPLTKYDVIKGKAIMMPDLKRPRIRIDLLAIHCFGVKIVGLLKVNLIERPTYLDFF